MDALLKVEGRYRDGFEVKALSFYWRVPEALLEDEEARQEAFKIVLDSMEIATDDLLDSALVFPVPVTLPSHLGDVRLGYPMGESL